MARAPVCAVGCTALEAGNAEVSTVGHASRQACPGRQSLSPVRGFYLKARTVLAQDFSRALHLESRTFIEVKSMP